VSFRKPGTRRGTSVPHIPCATLPPNFGYATDYYRSFSSRREQSDQCVCLCVRATSTESPLTYSARWFFVTLSRSSLMIEVITQIVWSQVRKFSPEEIFFRLCVMHITRRDKGHGWLKIRHTGWAKKVRSQTRT